VAQFVDLGKDIYDIYIRAVNPAFEKDLSGVGFEHQQGNLTYRIKVGVTAVDVAIL
jgi:hypothetical protein